MVKFQINFFPDKFTDQMRIWGISWFAALLPV